MNSIDRAASTAACSSHADRWCRQRRPPAAAWFRPCAPGRDRQPPAYRDRHSAPRRSPGSPIVIFSRSFASPFLPAGFGFLWTSWPLVMLCEEVADHLNAALGLLDMRHMGGVLEDLPTGTLDTVGERLHDRRRRLVVAAGHPQARARYGGALL